MTGGFCSVLLNVVILIRVPAKIVSPLELPTSCSDPGPKLPKLAVRSPGRTWYLQCSSRILHAS